MVRRQREFDGALCHLAPMRAFLRDVCRESWPAEPSDERLILQLELALTEAASNIILHGLQGQQNSSITVTLEVNDEQACVTLQYPGTPFDPHLAPAPSFDGSREDGFGLYLIGECVDEMHYGQDDRGQCVIHLVRKR